MSRPCHLRQLHFLFLHSDRHSLQLQFPLRVPGQLLYYCLSLLTGDIGDDLVLDHLAMDHILLHELMLHFFSGVDLLEDVSGSVGSVDGCVELVEVASGDYCGSADVGLKELVANAFLV